MDAEREIKRSKVIETQLVQTAEFLSDVNAFQIKSLDLKDYADNLRRDELEIAMLDLENMALTVGCKSGFWRRLKNVADNMGLSEKAEEYEEKFHNALQESR